MATKVDIFSGFLGAGKTTLIKKLIADGYNGQKIVLIENEFGQIGIDGGFLKESGIEITEMNSGCICCSLVGDFGTALKEVIDKYAPDRILIEPSGVGKLSDVVAAVKKVEGTEICGTVTVIDASKCKIYLKNFAEFYENQIKYAGTIILSRTGNIRQEKLDTAVELIKGINDHSQVITTPWELLSGVQILKAIESPITAADMAAALLEAEEHEHHHHHHDHDHEDHDHEHEHGEDCTCGCHDHDHEEHEHHHHDHDEHDHDHEHEHHHHDHDHGEGCTCGCHDHDHEGHHHADEVFDSIGFETSRSFTEEGIKAALEKLDNGDYGMILRAKGIVAGEDGKWIHFDYVPGEADVRTGAADVTGKLCVIGAQVDKDKVKELFGL
ncbi:Cobalamin synthesis protein cobW C-terminal domain-containing protein [Ruminococcaceae bacterium KH2T8]|nr:Cobalamin synthesis protein cobW C-terminal domain-containing protein [Ruminococcaceae bacterium KH2T8]